MSSSPTASAHQVTLQEEPCPPSLHDESSLLDVEAEPRPSRDRTSPLPETAAMVLSLPSSVSCVFCPLGERSQACSVPERLSKRYAVYPPVIAWRRHRWGIDLVHAILNAE